MADQTINVPQLLAVALVGFLALRWFMAKPSSDSPGSSSSSTTSSSRRPVDPAKVEQVAAMFPQLDRRNIAWDLQRNGQNVSATTERVLGGRQLDQAPTSFRFEMPSPSESISTSATGRSGGSSAKKGQPDLITRYNLQNRVGGKGKEAMPSEEQIRQGWSGDKVARAEGLKKRREEMVLEARRKMMEREAAAS